MYKQIKFKAMCKDNKLELAKEWDKGWRWGLLVGALSFIIPLIVMLLFKLNTL